MQTQNLPGRRKGTAKTGGRKAGVPNRITSDIREMVRTALDESGGVDYLKRQAEENPTAFLSLVARIMPPMKEEPTKNAVLNIEIHMNPKPNKAPAVQGKCFNESVAFPIINLD